MLKNYDELKASIGTLFEKSDDPETLKKLAEINVKIESMDKENTELLEKHTHLASEYRKAVMSAGLAPNGSADENGSSQPKVKTFEEVLAEVVSKRK